jgi:hypothetical protein
LSFALSAPNSREHTPTTPEKKFLTKEQVPVVVSPLPVSLSFYLIVREAHAYQCEKGISHKDR